jgi:O-methyltransferase
VKIAGALAYRRRARRDEAQLGPMIERARELSMVQEHTLRDLAHRLGSVLDAGVPGDVVECGVWRGGSSFLMAELLEARGDDRTVWMFDSFEGLPPPEEVDGARAAEWAANPDNPWYFDNCRADVEDVLASAERLGVAGRTRIVKGWFEETLPAHRDEIGTIALLRLDCDWHDSVITCLETLYDQVAPGGLVVIDDYHVWEGCTIAVHEFLGRRSLPHRIQTAANVAFFQKG